MILKDLILEYDDDPEMLANVLKLLDGTVRYIHQQGFYIRDFNPSKIILTNQTPNLFNFQGLIERVDDDPRRDININIYQMAKIGLMAYNHFPIDGKMNQDHFDFILNNLQEFNRNGLIPNDIYEYYEDLFINGNVNYLTTYLENKNALEGRSTGIRKSLATEAGRALSANGLQLNPNNEDKAFVNILFIPSILALLYLVGLVIYVFFIK